MDNERPRRCRTLGVLAMLLSLTALSACGLRPLYGNWSEVDTREVANIEVLPVPERIGQLLRNYLRNEFGDDKRENLPTYTMRLTTTEQRTPLIVRRDDVISRQAYSVVVYADLYNQQGALLFRTSSSVIADYAISNSEFATYSSRNDARDRSMEIAARDIRTQTAVFLLNQAKKK